MAQPSKLVTMKEGIAEHVLPGSIVLMGAQLEQMIPFAAGHEIIRQGIRGLTLAGPISDALFDQMIGAGCADRIYAAWVGNVSSGLGHCFRRSVEQSQPVALQVTDYSNFTLALALHAGALGVPFLPTFSTLGSDISKGGVHLREFQSPVSNDKLIAVAALKPDVAIIHVQRADKYGNSHLWGNLGVAVDGVRASRKVIVVAEEIVAPEIIASDPNRTLIPGFLVAAVVHEPGGAHPSPVQGYYGRDHSFFGDYHAQSRTVEGFNEWLASWVTDVPDRGAYLARLKPARTAQLEVREHAYSAAADFGY
jgi:glutaconate CoA-transferase subunit A